MTAEKIDKIRGTLKVGINTHKPAYGKRIPMGAAVAIAGVIAGVIAAITRCRFS
ncbi:MAG: hypothetical protein J5703_01615 [Methanomicrobium sp.]|nr:hypothetical protein [Methanomicrobium sp.]